MTVEKVPAAGRAARPSTGRKTTAKTTAIPAGVRKPADHASAKTDVIPEGIIVVEWREDPETKEPYKYQIDSEKLDDLDVVENLIGIDLATNDAGRSTYALKSLQAILGPEDYDLFKQREQITQGKVKFSATTEFYNSLMEQMNKGNS